MAENYLPASQSVPGLLSYPVKKTWYMMRGSFINYVAVAHPPLFFGFMIGLDEMLHQKQVNQNCSNNALILYTKQ